MGSLGRLGAEPAQCTRFSRVIERRDRGPQAPQVAGGTSNALFSLRFEHRRMITTHSRRPGSDRVHVRGCSARSAR